MVWHIDDIVGAVVILTFPFYEAHEFVEKGAPALS